MHLAVLALAVVVFTLPLAAEAQETGKYWRIGFLSPYSPEYDKSWRAALRHGLRDLGYVEGKNVVIEERHASGRFERFPGLVAELVRLKIDVFVVHGSDVAIDAARKASTTVPIVIVANPDPVGLGLVASLARPGGNITGLSDQHTDLAAKRLELLQQVVPSASRVGVLLNPTGRAQRLQWKDLQGAAPALRLTLIPLEMRGPDDIDRVFSTIRREGLHLLNVLGGAATVHQRQIADLAIKSRIAAISTTRKSAEDGFLMSYGAEFPDLYRRAASYVDRVLKGANPGDLPIEQPSRFEFVINMKTAKALGLTLPPSLLLRADHVIE